uniref:Uncharacterized protein n=1 Tax=viral metagenome TaxID=1070528 RepID=A0A6C0FLQ4_9ZZZZ|tara:strand:+ start:29 stop:805 length:777 start_codon:yes stop_codon:yes gene_type:complete
MFTYVFDNSQQYNELLHFVALFLLFVIGIMMYFMSNKADNLETEISKLEMECPACPTVPSCPESKECPACPSCPKCPSLTCDNDGKCPDCVCPASQPCPTSQPCPDCNKTCPENKECPKCPTVNDIVDGIFPGRNTGITKSGNYFDVKSSDSYDLMPDYDLYEPQAAFPSESVLPKTIMNFYKDHLITKDSIEDTPLSSNKTTTLSRSLGGPQPELGEVSLDDMPRMSRGNMGNPGNGTNNSISKNGLPSTTRSLSPQ